MTRWTPIPIVGGAYSDDCKPWSVQDCVNYIPVFAEKAGTRSPSMLRGVPGLLSFGSTQSAPVRGSHNVEGLLLVVAGSALYRISSTGSATSIGTIPGVGRVTFAHNQVSGGNQVAIANGQSGYVYDTRDGTLVQITDGAFPGFKVVDFKDGYILGVEPSGRYWFHSDLADALEYNSLDRQEAETAPDRIVTLIATGDDVFVLGERTGQFFYNSGESEGTFQNREGTAMSVGAASPWCACRLDNTVYWLGDDGIVYRLAGYTPQRVSLHAIEQAIARSDISQAYAFTFEDRGHKVFYLTFPDGQTWGYDVATNEWHRRKSKGLDRWRLSTLTRLNRRWIGGDYANGSLYELDWLAQHEAGEPLERRRITGVVHDDENPIIVNGFRVVFDTGMDDAVPLPSIVGDVPDGMENDASSGAYVVSGGIAPYSAITVLSGTFPPGLTLNSDGTWSGAFTTDGTYTWTVGGTDAFGQPFSVEDTAVVEADVDPFWDDVVSLWRPTGTLGSTTVDDEKPVFWGSPDAAQKPIIVSEPDAFSDTALAFDSAGLGDVIYTAESDGSSVVASPFGMDTGDFTYEGFVTFDSVSGTQTVLNTVTISPSPAVQISGGQWRVQNVSEGLPLIGPVGTAPDAGVRTFWQLRRIAGVLELSVGGTSLGTVAHTFDYSTTQPTHYGRQHNSSNPLDGRLEMCRITKGVGRTNAVPTRAFPNAGP